MYLHQSNVTEWTRCKYRYRLTVIEGLQPRFAPAPLRRGTLVHAGMESALLAHFEGLTAKAILSAGHRRIIDEQDKWLAQEYIAPHITPELLENAIEQCQFASHIFERAFKALGILEGEWETMTIDGKPIIEWEMRIPFEGFEGFQGAIDWVARHVRTDNVWLVDFKTRKSMQGEGYDDAQIQAPVYQHLLRTLHGMNLCGTATYQIRAAIPEVPEVNKTKKKGEDRPSMSRSSLATDWPTYRQTLIDEHLDPADYEDIRAKLKPFDRWDYTFRSAMEVERVWRTVRSHGAAILDAERIAQELGVEDAYPRSLNAFNCMGCSMRNYCLADLRGQDTDFLARTEYMREGEAPALPAIFDGDD